MSFDMTYEPHHEIACFLQIQKQRRRSAALSAVTVQLSAVSVPLYLLHRYSTIHYLPNSKISRLLPFSVAV